MSDENDSFYEELPERSSVTQMIEHGLKIGAEHLLVCTDSDESIPREPVFVLTGECVGKIEKACWRSSFNVEHFDLNEIRQREGLT